MEESDLVLGVPKPAPRQLPVMSAIGRKPDKRSETDVDSIMKALEYAPVFLPLPPTVRRQLCASLHLREVKQDEVIVKVGTELDFWYVMQGLVKEAYPESVQVNPDDGGDDPSTLLSAGDAFGVPLMENSATEDRMISAATYTTKKPTTLLWLNRDEVLRIAHPNKESTRRVEDSDGELTAITTYRAVGKGLYQQIVIKAAESALPEYLLADEGGPQFVEDFLLTLPVFMKDSQDLMEFLTNCIPEHADRVSSVLAIWLRSQNDEFMEKPSLRHSLDYIVSTLDACPPTANTKYLQALAKKMTLGETDSSFSVGKSQSVSSVCSRGSGGDPGEEDMASQSISDEFSPPRAPPPLSSTTSLPPGSLAPLATTASLPPSLSASGPLSSSSVGDLSQSLLRSTPNSLDRRKSGRFRRKTISRGMCGDKIPLKVFNPEGSFRIVPILDDYNCSQVLGLVVKAFGLERPAEHFTLVNVSVSPPDIVKQRNIQAAITKLSVYQRANSRIYLKDMSISGHVTSEETAEEIIRLSEISLHTLDLKELVRHVTMADFSIFRKILSNDYILDTFEMPSSIASEKRLLDAADIVNAEMMWVAHEVCLEPDMIKRSQVIRIFIELAVLFRQVRNFNSMLAIVSGLSYTAVARLKKSWEKVPRKNVQVFEDMQRLLDPSRNMANYRELLSNESIHPPFIPFFPIIKKDLTFLHLGNKTKLDGLINVDKLRMIASEVRKAARSTSRIYSGNDMLPGLPVLGTHLVTEQFDAPSMKKAHQYLMADQAVSTYMKSLEKFDLDEKTLLEKSRELETNDPSLGASAERIASTTPIFTVKVGMKRRQSTLRKAFNKFIAKE